MNIWLSIENQINYKKIYDLAKETKILPIKFKFTKNDESIYYEFTTIEELNDFYLSSIFFIKNTLEEGWELKDNIDWSVYTL